MVDHTAESIKSLEGIDRAWIEEAQSLSARSLQLLRPTIRKNGSEIWASWNPRYRTDPIDIFLRQNPPDGAIVVETNWVNNPWFPTVLADERLHEEYAHVWEGAYEEVGDNQFIPAGIVHKARKATVEAERHDVVVMGVDVARMGSDEIVFAIRRGRDARSEPWLFFRKMDTMETAARVAREIERLGPDAVMMKDWLAQGSVAVPDDPKLEAQLTSVLYKYDQNNAIQLERKDDPRRVKLGLPSPDRADALALTFAYPATKRMDDWQDETPRGRSKTTGY
jgi:phage terminase large subunit